MPIEAIESRIGQIQSTIATLSQQPSQLRSPAGVEAAGSGSVASGTTDFASQLETTMAQLGTSAGASTTDSASSTSKSTSAAPPATAAPSTPAASSTAVTGGSAGTASGNAIVDTAKKYLGTPYVWGGNSPSQGFDCSGLVKYVMKELGVDMPRVARDQAKVGTEIASLAEAQPGDLLGMRNGKHIAIYLGDNKILHAPQPGEKVSIRELFAHDDIDTIRRVAPAGSGASSTDLAARAGFEAASA